MATISAPAGSTGRNARALSSPATANRSRGAGDDVAEVADELEHGLVPGDRVDEPIAEPVPDTEDLRQPGKPRPALVRRAAREVGEVDGRSVPREIAQAIDARGGQQLGARSENQRCFRVQTVALPHQLHRKIGLERRNVGLQQIVADVLAVDGSGEGQHALEMLGHDNRHAVLDRLPALAFQPSDERGELGQHPELGLGTARPVGETEMHLERVVPIRIFVAQVVVVAVVPGNPALGAGEQRGVQDLPVVIGRPVVRGEIRGDAELLEHHRLPETARELADEGRGQELTHLIVLHRIDVRTDEVDQWSELAQRIAVVVAGDLDSPRPVAQRNGLGGTRRPHCLHDEPRPRGDLCTRARSAVQRHLVRNEPPHDRRVRPEATASSAASQACWETSHTSR